MELCIFSPPAELSSFSLFFVFAALLLDLSVVLYDSLDLLVAGHSSAIDSAPELKQHKMSGAKVDAR